ncbi:signal peptide peptidase SppA [Sphingomonas oligoaromativorans]|uniref:signal peptide peptidase SppA n=1 Tax=Sphingomonas oligoaromativorans TaxID=575322 RepID=UPI001421019E|nr:signal peptide peptidase SppA [Sphingomonas oligoaromativorans]NIJ31784.1 protease-4 [Sphingomonas oligoaromativorans]
MRFLRALWRFLMAVKDVLALIVLLLFFGLIFVALSSGGRTAMPAGGGALVLDLHGSLAEQPADARPIDFVSGAGGPDINQYRLRDVVRAVDAAATDKRVKAVVLDLDGFMGGGQAAVSTLGRSLDKVRAAGKPVLAYGTAYDDPSYQLASHASEVWLDPLGAVLTPGPGGSQLYYKGLLDKLGVNAHVYRVGKFKSAVEPYTRTEASPEARAANQALVDALWTRWQAEVAQARPKAHFADYLAGLTAGRIPNGTLAQSAEAFGLVDHLGDRLAFGDRVAQIVGKPDKAAPGDYKKIALDDWESANPVPTTGDAIGVLTVAGDIVDGKAPAGTAGGDSIADALGKAVAKGNLKALVVRVDSPGGSVTGSDRIRSAILAAKAKGLPVVVSMGTLAASGGYWVSTAGDTILADPDTITGSIGVFGIIPTFEGSLGKIGLSADGVRATPLSGQPDTLRGTTPEVDALIQAGITQTYARFTGLVAAARHMPVERVDEIGQGRVWDGVSAQKLGLVDRFGSLDDAVAEAARRAKLDPAKVHPVYIEREKPAFLRLLQMLAGNSGSVDEARSADAFAALGQRPDWMLARALGDARRILTGPTIQARCIGCGDVPPSPADLAAARRMMARAGL